MILCQSSENEDAERNRTESEWTNEQTTKEVKKNRGNLIAFHETEVNDTIYLYTYLHLHIAPFRKA